MELYRTCEREVKFYYVMIVVAFHVLAFLAANFFQGLIYKATGDARPAWYHGDDFSMLLDILHCLV